MSQLCYLDLGNMLQGQKKGPWSLGERKQSYMPEREVTGVLRERVCTGSLALRVFISFPKLGIIEKFSGEDLNRILISFPGVSFKNPGLY